MAAGYNTIGVIKTYESSHTESGREIDAIGIRKTVTLPHQVTFYG